MSEWSAVNTWRQGAGIAVADAEFFALTQQRAYHLWEQRGRPLWDYLRDWYDAEGQILTDPELVKPPRA